MVVKVSKLMVTAIRKAVKPYGYSISLEKVAFDLSANEKNYESTSKYSQVIKVIYPKNLYAMDRYITSNDLVSIYNKSDKSYDGFMDEVVKTIAI